MNLILTPATGSLAADLATQNPGIPNLSAVAGGGGLADLFVTPIALGWHLKRADIQCSEGLMLPTGRYDPGATNNVGTGYFGNHLLTGTTVYITKNKGTSANLFTDWEVHGARAGHQRHQQDAGAGLHHGVGSWASSPVEKELQPTTAAWPRRLRPVASNRKRRHCTDWVDESDDPSQHAPLLLGARHRRTGQYILPMKNLTFYVKGEHEYTAYSHFVGTTIVFGGVWTLRIPKPAPPKS